MEKELKVKERVQPSENTKRAEDANRCKGMRHKLTHKVVEHNGKEENTIHIKKEETMRAKRREQGQVRQANYQVLGGLQVHWEISIFYGDGAIVRNIHQLLKLRAHVIRASLDGRCSLHGHGHT